ncbi:MAG: hypothetical protein AABX59_00125 [Nanoarchaeota archaeon]
MWPYKILSEFRERRANRKIELRERELKSKTFRRVYRAFLNGHYSNWEEELEERVFCEGENGNGIGYFSLPPLQEPSFSKRLHRLWLFYMGKNTIDWIDRLNGIAEETLKLSSPSNNELEAVSQVYQFLKAFIKKGYLTRKMDIESYRNATKYTLNSLEGYMTQNNYAYT